MSKIIIELLLKIHFYYPIGIPIPPNDYAGYQMINEIVGKKIDRIARNENTEWSELVKLSKDSLKDYTVEDFSSRQAPGYFMAIEFNKSKLDGITTTTVVWVSLSLLIPSNVS